MKEFANPRKRRNSGSERQERRCQAPPAAFQARCGSAVSAWSKADVLVVGAGPAVRPPLPISPIEAYRLLDKAQFLGRRCGRRRPDPRAATIDSPRHRHIRAGGVVAQQGARIYGGSQAFELNWPELVDSGVRAGPNAHRLRRPAGSSRGRRRRQAVREGERDPALDRRPDESHRRRAHQGRPPIHSAGDRSSGRQLKPAEPGHGTAPT